MTRRPPKSGLPPTEAKVDVTAVATSIADRVAQLTAFSGTDLDTLFETYDSTPADTGPTVTPLPAADMSVNERIRRVLERSGGDYSRFVPPRVGRGENASDPAAIRTALQALATQRDVPIRRRRILLHIVRRMAQPVAM